MPNKESDLKDVFRLLGSWIVEIRLVNAIKYLDINKVSEGFAMKLLNLVYNYNLEDLNKIQENFPGLDLGDPHGSKIAFQVTSRTDTDKVISALKMVVAKNHQATFTGGIKFLILREGEKVKFPKTSNPKTHLPAFDIDTDILYPEHLSKAIEEIYDKDDLTRFLKIRTLVERELQFITTVRPEAVAEMVAATERRIQEKLDEQFASLAGLKAQGQQNFVYGSVENAEFPDWDLPGKREALATSYFETLQTKPLLWITGVSGTGKSSIAYIVAKKFEGSGFWIDLRDTPVAELPQILFNSLANSLHLRSGSLPASIQVIMETAGPGAVIVLNDLPDLAGHEKSYRAFTEFATGAIKNGINLIITSNFQPPLNFATNYGERLTLTPIPLFTEQETEDILLSFGAPDDVLKTHVQTVQILSEGYPVVINSMGAYLKDQNWKTGSDTINQIFKNDYSDQLNHEIYSKILSSTEDTDTLELLYRTRLIVGTFGTQELDAISNAAPVIKHPHQKFERIKGIWIQSVQQGKFQLSPLVKRLQSNLSTDTARAVNLSLAEALIKKKTLDQVEIGKAFHYFISAESYMDAAMMLVAVLREALSNPSIFFDWGFTLYWFYTPIPAPVNPPTKIFIRFLQVNVCMAAKEPYDFLLEDIRNILATEEVDKRAIGLAHMSFYQVLSLTDPMAAMSHLLLASKDIPLKELFKDDNEAENKERFQNAIWLPFCGCKTQNEFDGWFSQLSELPIDKALLDPATNQPYVAAGLSLYVNLLAERKPKDVVYLQSMLFDILAKALQAGVELIAAYCLRNLVVLLCEDINAPELAEELAATYQSFIDSNPIYKFLVYDELGRQYFVAGDNTKASRYLEQAVELEIPAFFTEQVAAYRVYGQVKGDDDPVRSLSFTQKALNFVLTHNFFPPVEIIKLYGEVGLAQWLTGDLRSSVDSFEKGYDLLHKVFDESLEHQAQVIRYGSTSNYVAQILMTGNAPTESEDGPYVVPKRGFFYFTNNAIHESGIYNRERRYMPAHLFQVTYQFLDNFETARKWALACIQIMVEVDEPRFAILLNCSLFYLVVDREYGKALNVFNYIRRHYKPQPAKGRQTGFSEEIQKISERINSNDAIFYNYLFAPIIFRVIPDILDDTIKESEYDQLTKELFENPELSISDQSTLAFIKGIFVAAIRGSIDLQVFNEKIKTYQGEYLEEVQVICYLLLSIHANAKHAANLQLSIVNRLETHYTGQFFEIFSLLINPFFENFWRIKARQRQTEFYDFGIWDSESIPRFNKETGKKRSKVLFQTLVYHLDLELPTQVSGWIKSK